MSLNNEANKFYNIDMEVVVEVEKELNITFPEMLKAFYRNYGYGFIHSKNGNINRIMDPNSVKDFRNREGDFEHYPDIEIYDIYEVEKLIFFEANESTMISIGFGEINKNKIFCYDTLIANDLDEFITKLIADDTYYYTML